MANGVRLPLTMLTATRGRVGVAMLTGTVSSAGTKADT